MCCPISARMTFRPRVPSVVSHDPASRESPPARASAECGRLLPGTDALGGATRRLPRPLESRGCRRSNQIHRLLRHRLNQFPERRACLRDVWARVQSSRWFARFRIELLSRIGHVVPQQGTANFVVGLARAPGGFCFALFFVLIIVSDPRPPERWRARGGFLKYHYSAGSSGAATKS